MKLKKTQNKLKLAEKDKNKAVTKVKKEMSKADKRYQKIIIKKDKELEMLRKELIEQKSLKEEAFGVIRSLSDMA